MKRIGALLTAAAIFASAAAINITSADSPAMVELNGNVDHGSNEVDITAEIHGVRLQFHPVLGKKLIDRERHISFFFQVMNDLPG